MRESKSIKIRTHISNEKIIALFFLIIASFSLIRLFGTISDHLSAPFDLIYETPGLSAIKSIQNGLNPYSPEIYAKPPFLIIVYTPLYHYIVAQFSALDNNPFLWGRIVSMIAMFASAFSLFFVLPKSRNKYLPFILFCLFFSIWSVSKNTAILKNDSLALLFSVYAIITIHRSISSKGIFLASLLCMLAFFSKQSYISASITCFIFLFTSRRNFFSIYLILMLLFSIVSILLIQILWGDGFWFSTVVALQQPLNIHQGVMVWKQEMAQPAFCFFLFISLYVTYSYIKNYGLVVFQESPYLIYMLTTLAILLLTIGKQGSSDNYFHEFILSQFLWIIYALRKKQAADLLKPLPLMILGGLVICYIYDFSFSGKNNYSFINKKTIQMRTYTNYKMKKIIDSFNIQNPVVLDLESPIYLYSMTNNISLNDPWLYKMLWHNGLLHYFPLLDGIKDQYFDIILIQNRISPDTDLEDPYDNIVRDIFLYYQLGAKGDYFNYYIPKKSK